MLRIQAHCFVTTASARAAVESAFQDRRLAKVTPTVLTGGFEAAEARYAREVSPALILIEVDATVDGSAALIERIAALAEVCDVGSNLILLGTANDIDLYRVLRRHGVADYLRLPLDPERLVEVVRGLFDDPERAAKGQSVAVIGAKGGCGSSTLAASLAHALADQSDDEAILLDLDLHFGSADLSCNVEAAAGIPNALGEPERIDELFLQRFAARYDERLQLLTAPCTLDADGRIEAERLEAAVEAIRRHARWVVLDLPHLWAGWVQRALRMADTVVVVIPVDLAGLRNARSLLDWLAAERRGLAEPVVVVNGAGGERKPMIDLNDFLKTLAVKAPVVIPEDREAFRAALSAGRMVTEVRPRSRAAVALRRLAAGLVEATPGARPKRRPARPGAIVGRLLDLLPAVRSG